MSEALRILLLQARYADDPMRDQEVRAFAKRCGLPRECFRAHDLLAGPPSPARVGAHDALMIGGSGDFLVSKQDLPSFRANLDVLAELAGGDRPMFASCFGFQCLVEALGGEIVHDPEHTEVGTYPVELTPAGEQDELLGSLPRRFVAQMGRKDRAARLPAGLVNLASSERCPLQAFRVPGRPVWATQFHPELCRADNLERYKNYIGAYAPHMREAERRAAFDRFSESPETERLLPRFLELVFGRQPAAAARG